MKSDDVIRAINVAGTLAFARDRDTLLNAGLIKIEASDDYSEEGFDCDAHVAEPDAGQPRPTLEVGTPNEPIPAEHTAVIRLHYVEGLDKESCPAIVCCGGRMDFHGAPLSRTWVKLGATATKGDDRSRRWPKPSPAGKVGDHVIVTADATRTTRHRRTAPRSGRSRRSTARSSRSTSRWSTSTWATATTAAKSPT